MSNINSLAPIAPLGEAPRVAHAFDIVPAMPAAPAVLAAPAELILEGEDVDGVLSDFDIVEVDAIAVAPLPAACEMDEDDEEIVAQAASMQGFGHVFVNDVRRSTRQSRPTDFYVHPDHAELILEGEDVDGVLSDFDADSDADADMDEATDSDSDYEDY